MDLRHVFWEANHVADHLASTGSKLSKLEVIIWEAPPNDTVPLLQRDMLGMVWPRRLLS